MGWEERNGRRYYYRKRRDGRHVTSEYLGQGAAVKLITDLEQATALRRRAVDSWEREERERDRQIDRDLDGINRLVRALVSDAMTDAGYHRHKGQWRKKRHDESTNG